jgi:hypothetical protein
MQPACQIESGADILCRKTAMRDCIAVVAGTYAGKQKIAGSFAIG